MPAPNRDASLKILIFKIQVDSLNTSLGRTKIRYPSKLSSISRNSFFTISNAACLAVTLGAVGLQPIRFTLKPTWWQLTTHSHGSSRWLFKTVMRSFLVSSVQQDAGLFGSCCDRGVVSFQFIILDFTVLTHSPPTPSKKALFRRTSTPNGW